MSDPIASDTIRPKPVLSTSAPSPTNSLTIDIDVDFGEPVYGLNPSDIDVSGGFVVENSLISKNESNNLYVFEIETQIEGTVSITIPKNVLEDGLENLNLASDVFTHEFDGLPPIVTLSSDLPTTTNMDPIPVCVQISDSSVTDFTESDVHIVNGIVAAGSLTPIGGPCNPSDLFDPNSIYFTLDVIPSGQGLVEISVPAGRVQDTAGNVNEKSNILIREYDSIPPMVVITLIDPNPPMQIIIVFMFNSQKTQKHLQAFKPSHHLMLSCYQAVHLIRVILPLQLHHLETTLTKLPPLQK